MANRRATRTLRILWTSTLWMLATGLATSHSWAEPPPEVDPTRWGKQIAAFEAQDRQHLPPEGGIVFVGSSSIRRWDLPKYFPDLPVINRGFGGSHVSDSVHYAGRIILPYKPRVVVVYAGDNDIRYGKRPQQVFQDYQALVGKIHHAQPSVKIVYISIKPSIARWSYVAKMREANRLIRQATEDDRRLVFVDIDTPMIGVYGRPRKELFVADGLHLNDQGYRLWADLVRPHLAPDLGQWHQFRGPHGDGHADDSDLPLRFSETENVTWKTPVHGQGWSSPVVWDQQIWMTTATRDGRAMFVVCVDRDTGSILHDRKLFDNDSPREKHALNSYASPTPVIEQGRVYVHFGSYGTACLDTRTANTIWARRDLPCNHWRGPGSSPILLDDRLIVHFDGYDYQYVVALDKATGKTIWKANRNIDYGTDDGDMMKAYSTPIVIEHAGRRQLISPASKASISYDPRTGQELWRIRFPEYSSTARPLYGHGLLYINTGFARAQLLAVRPDGHGDVTESHIQWAVNHGVGSKPSPLLVGNRLYVVHDRGTAACLNAKTGAEIWARRLGGMYSASPVYAKGRIYLCSHEGKVTVLEEGPEYHVLAQNTLDDGFMASPAVVGDSLILRTRSHVYRIDG